MLVSSPCYTRDDHIRASRDNEVLSPGNMHGNEVVGRSLILTLARLLLQNYNTDPHITHLLSTTRIHLLPSLNPDGFERAIPETDSYTTHGRANANDADLNRDFPSQYTEEGGKTRQPETEAVIGKFSVCLLRFTLF